MKSLRIVEIQAEIQTQDHCSIREKEMSAIFSDKNLESKSL
jgi:hypothetical protein